MNSVVEKAFDVLNQCQITEKMSYNDYIDIFEGLDYIETVAERDELLEELWEQFGDVPMNPETEKMEARFLCFPTGTEREEIWRWFDARYSTGVAGLLYKHGGDDDHDVARIYRMKKLCCPCDEADCVFNRNRECRLPLIECREPIIRKSEGEDYCLDCIFNKL